MQPGWSEWLPVSMIKLSESNWYLLCSFLRQLALSLLPGNSFADASQLAHGHLEGFHFICLTWDTVVDSLGYVTVELLVFLALSLSPCNLCFYLNKLRTSSASSSLFWASWKCMHKPREAQTHRIALITWAATATTPFHQLLSASSW